MKWTRRPGPRMARTLRQARANYVWGEYTLRWVGSTHGVWTVECRGYRIGVVDTLTDAKQWAEKHHATKVHHAGRQT